MNRILLITVLVSLMLSLAMAADIKLGEEVQCVEARAPKFADALANSRASEARCQNEDTEQDCPGTPPTPTQVMREQPSCSGGGDLELGWREQQNLPGGSSFISQIESLVRSRSVFDCLGQECLTVVPTYSNADEGADVRTISACSVTVSAGVAGPPWKCEPLVMTAGAITLMRAVVGRMRISCLMGTTDFRAVFHFRAPAQSPSSIIGLVKEVLAGRPFNLSVSQEESAVVGTRAYLPSELFPDWREWATVRADVSSFPKADVVVAIATTILVSKQNSSDRGSWTAASEQQESVYIQALRNEFIRRGAVIDSRH